MMRLNSVARASWALFLLFVLASCGGGGGGKAGVTNLSASGLFYQSTMTVVVNGSGFTGSGLNMVVEGACGPVTDGSSPTDTQVSFSCKVGASGTLVPRIRDGSGTELASLRLEVPKPQVRMSVKQGDRSGSFVLELDPNAAPVTVTNFLNLVAAGFYTNTIFHRVEANSLVQGGGYLADLSLKAGVFPTIKLESDNGLKNLRATVAMARTSVPDSATTQFYLNLTDNPGFDYQSAVSPGYAVFGTVVSGMEVVDEIGKVELAPATPNFSKRPLLDVLTIGALRLK